MPVRTRFNYRLSKEDFHLACSEIRMREVVRKIVYRVMVLGEKADSIDRSELSRSGLYKAIRRMTLAHITIKHIPKDWNQIDLFFSPELLKKIQVMQENELNELNELIINGKENVEK